MKTIKTSTLAYQIEGRDALIIGYSDGNYFVKTQDGIMVYNHNEMIDIYQIPETALKNIRLNFYC